MALIAEMAITLDVEFGQVDFQFIDTVIHEALAAAHIPVLNVETEALRPANDPLPTMLGAMPLAPGAAYHPVPLGSPGPFGRGTQL